MYQYPYGDTQQLNLDWILTKLKELEAGEGSGGSSIEDVAHALISATYNSATQYRRYDYCYLNEKLYRCLSDTSGAFNPAAWQEVLLGDDIPILTRLVNAIDASLTSLQTTVDDLDSDDVDNASASVPGTTVTEALDSLGSRFAEIRTGDFHDILSTGLYYVYNAVLNKPYSQGGFYTCAVAENGSLYGIYSTFGRVYEVRCTSNQWEYIRIDYDHFEPNETYTETNTVINGLTRNGSKDIILRLTLPISLNSISTIAVNVLNGNIFNTSGQVIGGTTDFINYLALANVSSVVATIISDNTVLIKISCSTAITNASNGSTVFYGNISLTFT